MATATEDVLPLPDGFTSVKRALSMAQGTLIDVVGVVKDCRAPTSTFGSDFKCTIRVYDTSTTEGEDIELNIFRRESDMPVVGCGDVVAMTKVKVQGRCGLSLVTNRAGAIRVYEATKIPNYPDSASSALRPLTKADKGPIKTDAEIYISWLYQNIDKSSVPDAQTFQLALDQSKNVRDKFSLLQDFRQDKFYDMVVFVAREPYDYGDKMTLWVTDFTRNEAFFNFTWDGGDWQGETAPSFADPGDPYGYTGKFRKSISESNHGFDGPYGKYCLQLTCYEPHATLIRKSLRKGSWVQLRNVQIKYGTNGNSLEGFLRQDLGSVGSKVQVNPLDPQDSPENISPRLKDAIRRMRDYRQTAKAQAQQLRESTHGQKRPLADEPKPKHLNAKKRRQLARAEAGRRAQADEQEQAGSSLDLNENVRCENSDRPPSSVAQLLKRAVLRTEHENRPLEVALPFTCVKSRLNVRVIDFFPSDLEAFAVSRKCSDYDALSERGNESDSEGDEDDGSEGHRVWEWRFALRLQDAAVPSKGTTAEDLWAVVDNADAQLLIGLDACDLRSDKEALDSLRDRMFLLWGELAEFKAKRSKPTNTKALGAPVNMPPMDSSDVEEDARPKRPAKDVKPFANRPFSCCIRQYGVKVKEDNPLNADAGEGRRWDRVFGLFGTKIRYC